MPPLPPPSVLHPATEECPFCLHRYVYELEFRCYDCDRPVCPICVVTLRAQREMGCPECGPGEGEGVSLDTGEA